MKTQVIVLAFLAAISSAAVLQRREAICPSEDEVLCCVVDHLGDITDCSLPTSTLLPRAKNPKHPKHKKPETTKTKTTAEVTKTEIKTKGEHTKTKTKTTAETTTTKTKGEHLKTKTTITKEATTTTKIKEEDLKKKTTITTIPITTKTTHAVKAKKTKPASADGVCAGSKGTPVCCSLTTDGFDCDGVNITT